MPRYIRCLSLLSPSSLDRRWTGDRVAQSARERDEDALLPPVDDDDEATPVLTSSLPIDHTAHTTHTAIMSWFGFGGAKKEETPESSYDFAAGPASGCEESVGGGGGYEPSMGGGECVWGKRGDGRMVYADVCGSS